VVENVCGYLRVYGFLCSSVSQLTLIIVQQNEKLSSHYPLNDTDRSILNKIGITISFSWIFPL
jgi:hypothetical protein